MNWTVEPVESFSDRKREWGALNAGRAASILQDPDYWEIQLRHWGRGDERIAVARDGGEAKAMTLVSPRGRGVWATFQPSQAPLGAWVGADVAAADLPALMRRLGLFTLSVGITQQDPDHHPRPGDDARTRTGDYIETGRITMPGTFDEYWSSRGRNLRKNLRRQRNGLERDGVTPHLKIVRDRAGVADAIRGYGELESAGWKSESGTAVAADNDQGRFYRELFEHFAERGEAAIWQYRFEDRLVACNLCLVRDGVHVILKTTYDESVQGSSPALLLNEDALRESMEGGGLRIVEFYGPAVDWHRKWSEEFRTLYHLTSYRAAAIGAAHRWISARRRA